MTKIRLPAEVPRCGSGYRETSTAAAPGTGLSSFVRVPADRRPPKGHAEGHRGGDLRERSSNLGSRSSTREDGVHALRLHAICRATELGDVSAADREAKILRTAFYRRRKRSVPHGCDGLRPREAEERRGRLSGWVRMRAHENHAADLLSFPIAKFSSYVLRALRISGDECPHLPGGMACIMNNDGVREGGARKCIRSCACAVLPCGILRNRLPGSPIGMMLFLPPRWSEGDLGYGEHAPSAWSCCFSFCSRCWRS